MAGIQHCCRKLLIYNTSRLINKNGTLLQPNRKKHYLIFQIASPQNRWVFQKSKLCTERHLIFRLASSNVNTLKEPKPEITQASQSVSSNSEAGVVQSSNSNIVIDETSLPPIPRAEVTDVPFMEFISTGLKEPSFESLGLGSWWPSGIIQQLFEYLHINWDIPWWQAIIAVTLCTRVLLFPVNLSVRRDTVNMLNNLPGLMTIQEKISQAKTVGDYYGVAVATQEMQTYIKEKNINMFGFLRTAIIQGPVFLSMYYALRGMSNVPVESMKTGGILWFTDLTMPDPYYILPVVLSATLFAIIELGAEGNPAKASSSMIKLVMRGLPIIVCGVSTRFSSCVTLYWTVSNFIVLGQVGLLTIPPVRRFFNIPVAIKHNPSEVKKDNRGFIEGFKEGFSNIQLTAQIEDRERLNIMKFEKAGSGPIPRTFKKNPLLTKDKK